MKLYRFTVSVKSFLTVLDVEENVWSRGVLDFFLLYQNSGIGGVPEFFLHNGSGQLSIRHLVFARNPDSSRVGTEFEEILNDLEFKKRRS